MTHAPAAGTHVEVQPAQPVIARVASDVGGEEVDAVAVEVASG
jgi:hypothetical protein